MYIVTYADNLNIPTIAIQIEDGKAEVTSLNKATEFERHSVASGYARRITNGLGEHPVVMKRSDALARRQKWIDDHPEFAAIIG